MNRFATAFALLALVSACAKRASEQSVGRHDARTRPVPTSRRPTIDPKSTEAAVELARAFTRLIDCRQFNEAYMLLGANAPARSRFDDDFSHFSNLRVTLGTAGLQDGAAGSIYVSIPLTVAGRRDGRDISRSADLAMRRVNDVPGSTDAERHWHIDRINWRKKINCPGRTRPYWHRRLRRVRRLLHCFPHLTAVPSRQNHRRTTKCPQPR